MSDDASGNGRAVSLADEQAYLSMLYRLLDKARERSEELLRNVQRDGEAGGTHQARLERDVSAAEHERRLDQLNATERGLCFGRTDDIAGYTLYIGRIGLRDDGYQLKLIDWRAPAARPFYAATPNDPHGLVRRRHIYTRNRTVTGLDDEVFDLERLSDEDKRGLSGEALLIATINRARTGRMTDVVATIQAEQDRVIRSQLQGVLVVQGGPGTGKTVAALHRAAYLLYTHRRTLERRGVLVIGPNPTFLRYISQVLPSLGETDVVLRTIGDLFPGVQATDTDDPGAVVKGDLRMVKVLQRAVAARQRVPAGDLVIDADGVQISVAHDICQRARDRAQALRKPHNVARKLFVTEMLTAIARAEARTLDRPLEDEDLPYVRERLWSEPGVQAAVDALWPSLTPQRFLADFYAEGSGLSSSERAVVHRPVTPDRWTVADVPLLDEAAELLGTDNSAQRRARRIVERERRAEARYAREVLEMTGVASLGMLDAETLAEWNRDNGPALTTAERAAQDRGWTYGHVIVDEAQELSAMAWRMLFRRNPSRSMTVVGDIGQTGSPAGAHSWEQMLGPGGPAAKGGARGRWREERLTVNYRTPEEIMALAGDVLASAAPGERPPESVRAEGVAPRAVAVALPPAPGRSPSSPGRSPSSPGRSPSAPGRSPSAPGRSPSAPGHSPSSPGHSPSSPRPGRSPSSSAPSASDSSPDISPFAGEVARIAREDLVGLNTGEGGKLAIIAPPAWLPEIAGALPEAVRGDLPEALDAQTALLTVTQAKGLEFDRVVLVDPAAILSQSRNGGRDLYVAITRATHRLTVVYTGELPACLGRLQQR